MKIFVPENVLNNPSFKCWEYVADRVKGRLLEIGRCDLYAAVHATCSEAFSRAMDGGFGATESLKKDEARIEVTMHRVSEWTVNVYGQLI